MHREEAAEVGAVHSGDISSLAVGGEECTLYDYSS